MRNPSGVCGRGDDDGEYDSCLTTRTRPREMPSLRVTKWDGRFTIGCSLSIYGDLISYNSASVVLLAAYILLHEARPCETLVLGSVYERQLSRLFDNYRDTNAVVDCMKLGCLAEDANGSILERASKILGCRFWHGAKVDESWIQVSDCMRRCKYGNK
jgi:hypothetical protein